MLNLCIGLHTDNLISEVGIFLPVRNLLWFNGILPSTSSRLTGIDLALTGLTMKGITLRQVCWLFTITISLVLLSFGKAGAKSYPRNGHFKRLPLEKDWWYSIDRENWDIKAPDKWQHFMGSYALAEVIHHITEKKGFTILVAVGLGIVKEYDDAYREGWSPRDLYMDISGVAASTILPDNLKLLAYYDDTEVMLKLSLLVH